MSEEVKEISAAELARIELKLKETKEFVKGCIDLGKVISSEMQDGFQSSDLISIARKLAVDVKFRETIWEAVKGLQNIPEELRQENPADIAIELGSLVLDNLRK